MKRRVRRAFVPAAVVFVAVLGVLFAYSVQAGVTDWSRWSPPDVFGIGWPIGFPFYAAAVALPVFLVALASLSVVDREKRA